jgi:transcriptional regulator with XRE-family HTH domain
MGKQTLLKLYRISNDLTQAQLADLIRSYQQRVSRIECGSSPTPDEVEALSSVLGVPPASLFTTHTEEDSRAK